MPTYTYVPNPSLINTQSGIGKQMTAFQTSRNFNFSGGSAWDNFDAYDVEKIGAITGQPLCISATLLDTVPWDGQEHAVLRFINGGYVSVIKTHYANYDLLSFLIRRDSSFNIRQITWQGSAFPDLYLTVLYEENVLGMIYGSTCNLTKISRTLLDQFLGNYVVPKDWEAWDYISGNNGQFRASLTEIKKENIGDFSSYQAVHADGLDRISPQASIWGYFQNAVYDVEQTVAYSGNNWVSLTCSAVTGQPNQVKFTFKFYIPNISETTPFYTHEEVLNYNGVTPSTDYYLSFIHDDNFQAAVFLPVKYSPAVVLGEYAYYNGDTLTDDDMLYMWLWLQASGAGEPESPYDTGTTDNGGNPPGDTLPNDMLTSVNVPAISGMSSGLFTIYCPTEEQLSDIASFLWSADVLDNFKKYFNNFADNLISLYVLPYKAANMPTKAFKVGNVESETITSVEYCTSRFVSLDMGSIVIGSVWDSYLDFSPYTKFNIYLPGVGVQALDADDILAPLDRNKNFAEQLGSTISLTYVIDLMTGICVAYVKINGSIKYQFPGKISYTIPLTGETYASLIRGFATATAGAVGTIATGGAAAPFAAGAATAAIIDAMKPDVYRGGNLSGDVASMSYATPYLIRRTPNKPELIGQAGYTGFQSYKSGKLKNFSGYTEVLEVHVEGFSCTEIERSALIELLKNGVIL